MLNHLCRDIAALLPTCCRSVCRRAVCLTCRDVSHLLCRPVSCAATAGTPMPLDTLALAGPASFAWPEDALALLSASAFLQHRSVLSCRYFHPGFTNSTFIFLSFLGKYFPSFSAAPTAKNTSPVNKVKASVSAPFLSDYLHSYLEGICGTEVLTHNLVIQFPGKLPPSK